MSSDVIYVIGTRPPPPQSPGVGSGGGGSPFPDDGYDTNPTDPGGVPSYPDDPPESPTDPCESSGQQDELGNLPDGIQSIRSTALFDAAADLHNRSWANNEFEEFGRFIVRNSDGSIELSDLVTSGHPSRINFAFENGQGNENWQVLSSITPLQTIVGFIHTQKNDPRPSFGDRQFVDSLVSGLTTRGVLANIDPKIVSYVVYSPASSNPTAVREFSLNTLRQILNPNTPGYNENDDPCGYRI